MKVIDLLNKIANGEEVPKKIQYENNIYIHIDNYCYYCDETNLILSDRIFAEYSKLNDEVEIIEEDKKIEYVPTYVLCDSDFETKGNYSKKAVEIIDKAFRQYSDAINKLIDEVNKLKKEGK